MYKYKIPFFQQRRPIQVPWVSCCRCWVVGTWVRGAVDSDAQTNTHIIQKTEKCGEVQNQKIKVKNVSRFLWFHLCRSMTVQISTWIHIFMVGFSPAMPPLYLYFVFVFLYLKSFPGWRPFPYSSESADLKLWADDACACDGAAPTLTFHLGMYLYTYLRMYLYIYLRMCLYIYLACICTYIWLVFVHIFAHVFVHIFGHVFVHIFAHVFVYLFEQIFAHVFDACAMCLWQTAPDSYTFTS